MLQIGGCSQSRSGALARLFRLRSPSLSRSSSERLVARLVGFEDLGLLGRIRLVLAFEEVGDIGAEVSEEAAVALFVDFVRQVWYSRKHEKAVVDYSCDDVFGCSNFVEVAGFKRRSGLTGEFDRAPSLSMVVILLIPIVLSTISLVVTILFTPS